RGHHYPRISHHHHRHHKKLRQNSGQSRIAQGAAAGSGISRGAQSKLAQGTGSGANNDPANPWRDRYSQDERTKVLGKFLNTSGEDHSHTGQSDAPHHQGHQNPYSTHVSLTDFHNGTTTYLGHSLGNDFPDGVIPNKGCSKDLPSHPKNPNKDPSDCDASNGT